MSGFDGRFAPSPTGPLHLGSLRTALVAWLFARTQRASFRLRIDDLDPQRSRREHEAGQLADLRSLGLDWDGTPLRQSARHAAYAAALSALAAEEALYPCFCTRAEIRQAASAPHGALAEGTYPGTCRRLSTRERSARIEAGRPHALRLRADAARVSFTDRLLGEQTQRVDDFVLRRADGVAAYQLAVVLDDAAQNVGEVVRGADLLASTGRQILLARRLGLGTPCFAHIGLVLGPDGVRLAKRHGAVTLADRGEPPERTLAWLAHSLGLAEDQDAIAHPSELIAEFDPERLPRGDVRL